MLGKAIGKLLGIVGDLDAPLAHIGRRAEHLLPRARGLARGADQAPIFHGSAAPWAHGMGSITKGRGKENLFGPGLYMTTNRRIAAGYAMRQKPGQDVFDPIMYGLRWKHRPNLIDLEKPFTADVAEVINPILKKLYPSGRITAHSNKTGKEIFGYFRNSVEESDLLNLSNQLRKRGYHGFSFLEHQKSGGTLPYQVRTAFDPEKDLELMGSVKFDEFRSNKTAKVAALTERINRNIEASRTARLSSRYDPNISRLEAAASGPPSVAAKGQVSISSLRESASSSLGATVRASTPAPVMSPAQSMPMGSSAGLMTNKKAYVQMNGADYDAMQMSRRMALNPPSRSMSPAAPMPPYFGTHSNYSAPNFHGVAMDRHMSAMI